MRAMIIEVHFHWLPLPDEATRCPAEPETVRARATMTVATRVETVFIKLMVASVGSVVNPRTPTGSGHKLRS